MSVTGSTTRISRVGTVILPDSDQDKALDFYMGTLGFESRMDGSFAESDHSAMVARGVDADAELIRMGEDVPPMFTFRDPDGNRFRMVERE